MNGFELRAHLKASLRTDGTAGAGALLIEELGLRHGRARIDLALVNGAINGFEIKSEHDSLRRLDRQVFVYNTVLDHVTLVLAPTHVSRANGAIPAWWGVPVAHHSEPRAVEFERVRDPEVNPLVDPVAQAKLLWRTEVLELLAELGVQERVSRRPRQELYELFAASLDRAQLRAKICERLRHRTGWRSA
jgi:hypothetical protein